MKIRPLFIVFLSVCTASLTSCGTMLTHVVSLRPNLEPKVGIVVAKDYWTFPDAIVVAFAVDRRGEPFQKKYWYQGRYEKEQALGFLDEVEAAGSPVNIHNLTRNE